MFYLPAEHKVSAADFISLNKQTGANFHNHISRSLFYSNAQAHAPTVTACVNRDKLRQFHQAVAMEISMSSACRLWYDDSEEIKTIQSLCPMVSAWQRLSSQRLQYTKHWPYSKLYNGLIVVFDMRCFLNIPVSLFGSIIGLMPNGMNIEDIHAIEEYEDWSTPHV